MGQWRREEDAEQTWIVFKICILALCDVLGVRVLLLALYCLLRLLGKASSVGLRAHSFRGFGIEIMEIV
jgi:hypothetical protein